jgi:hypothetical protein
MPKNLARWRITFRQKEAINSDPERDSASDNARDTGEVADVHQPDPTYEAKPPD